MTKKITIVQVIDFTYKRLVISSGAQGELPGV